MRPVLQRGCAASCWPRPVRTAGPAAGSGGMPPGQGEAGEEPGGRAAILLLLLAGQAAAGGAVAGEHSSTTG